MAKLQIIRQGGDADLGFVTARGMVAPVIPATTGTTYFVSSTLGNAANGGKSPTDALATITGALAKCTASVGDVIVVMPGHVETLSGAGALALNVAGVSIIGLGNHSNRPTLTLHTTATTIAASAANVTLRNIRVATDVDAVVKMFNVTAAGVTLDAVDFADTAACAPLQFVLATAATRLTVINCRWVQTLLAATALQQWIALIGADGFVCKNNYAYLTGYPTSNPANGVIVGASTLSSAVLIEDNRFVCAGGSTGAIPISLYTGTTGLVANNYVASSKTAIAGSIGLASCYGALNYAAHVVNKNGLLEPVVDA